MKIFKISALVTILLLAVSCTSINPFDSENESDEIGSVEVSAYVAQSVAAAKSLAKTSDFFASGDVVLTRKGVDTTYPLTIANGKASALLEELKIGKYDMKVTLYHISGEASYSGSSSVVVEPKATAAAAVPLYAANGKIGLDFDLPYDDLDMMPEGLVLWNKMESVSAGSIPSELGVYLTEEGTVTYTSGRYGNGAYVNDGGAFYNNSAVIPLDAWTIEWWFRDTSTTEEYRRWFTTTTGNASSGGRDIIFREHGFGNFALWLNTQWMILSYPAASYKDGNFHHYAITYDSVTAVSKVYIDGVLLGTMSSVVKPSAWKESIILGGYNSVITTEASIGTFDNFKVYNYAKTDFSDRFVE